jgi:hypothetical protein
MFAARSASADEARLAINWERLAEAINSGGATILPWERADRLAPRSASFDREERFFGGAPHVSLVARDWGASQVLVGNMSVTDAIRLSRSIRMAVTRVRLSEGRFVPFAQLGLGQWRIDTDLMPHLPHDTELATQVGGGFELHLARNWTCALELDYTVLIREAHEPQMVMGPHILGTFLGTRTVF